MSHGGLVLMVEEETKEGAGDDWGHSFWGGTILSLSSVFREEIL
jgi:hypothetical protein